MPDVPDPAVTPAAGHAVVTLLRRARLVASDAPAACTPLSLRVVGLPLLVAAAAASGSTTYVVRPGDTLDAIAQRFHSSPAALARTNHLADPDRLAVGQRLTVPAPAPRPAAKPAVKRPKPARSIVPTVTYTVRRGDTLGAIARRARVSLRSLLAVNRLTATTVIHPGQRLVLPVPPQRAGTPPFLAHPPQPAPAKRPVAAPVVHVVGAGETVSSIALHYHVSIRVVLVANRLPASGLIRVGQHLVIPGARAAAPHPAPTPAPRPAPVHPYTVRSGDTLSAIATANHVDLREVLTLNRLTSSSVIHPGQKLLLPGPPPAPNTFLGRTYPDAVVRAAAANRAALAHRAMPTRDQMRALVASTARARGVKVSLALAIAYQESGFNPRVVSPANAIGCMQVIPSAGQWASAMVGRRLDLLDPRDNVTAGVAILASLTASAPEPQAIAGYYQGLGSVRKNGMFPDTRRYVASVLTLEARFRNG